MDLEELDCDEFKGIKWLEVMAVFGLHASSVKTSHSNTTE